MVELELVLPDCPECGGDMMGYPHPLRREVLVWACRCCGSTFVYDPDYRLQALPILHDLADTDQEEG